jgi:hypothetical protein
MREKKKMATVMQYSQTIRTTMRMMSKRRTKKMKRKMVSDTSRQLPLEAIIL